MQIAWFDWKWKRSKHFCPHFIQLSNLVSIRTIYLFHYSVPPKFLSVKWENLKNCLSGLNSKLVGFYQINSFLFAPGISTWMRLSTCRQVVWCSERGMSQWDQEDSASGNLFLCWHRVARAAQRLERPPATQPDSPTALMTIFGHTGHPRLPLVESMVGLPAGGPVLIQAPRPVKVDSVVWGWTSRRRYPISRTNNRGRANS